jgi:hypothetical protein
MDEFRVVWQESPMTEPMGWRRVVGSETEAKEQLSKAKEMISAGTPVWIEVRTVTEWEQL